MADNLLHVVVKIVEGFNSATCSTVALGRDELKKAVSPRNSQERCLHGGGKGD